MNSHDSDNTAVCPHAESEPIVYPTSKAHPFNPPDALGTIRETQPICRLRYPDGHVGWLITSYELSRALLTDPRFTLGTFRLPYGDPETESKFDAALKDLPESAGFLQTLDPPQHTRVRRALARYFTVRELGARSAMIGRIVSDQLDEMERSGGPVDLLTAFSLPVSSLTICELLGASRDDREEYERPSQVMEDPASDAEQKVAALNGFYEFCRDLIARKRSEPGDDLLSHLLLGGELTTDEIVGAAQILFEAGHETTALMLTSSVFTLLSDPGRWEDLAADPSLLPDAIEELLRYLNIVQGTVFARTALEDLEFAGERIKAGESVSVSLAVANRDPRKFDNPDELDISRSAVGHLAFGHGRHMCIGQHLARLETRIALAALMDRFPTLRLAIPASEVEFRGGDFQLGGALALPVAW